MKMEQETTEAIEKSVPTETETSEPVTQTQSEIPLREAIPRMISESSRFQNLR